MDDVYGLRRSFNGNELIAGFHQETLYFQKKEEEKGKKPGFQDHLSHMTIDRIQEQYLKQPKDF